MPLSIFAQITAAFESKKQTLRRDAAANKEYELLVVISDFAKDTKVTIKKTAKGNAVADKDYKFEDFTFSATKGASGFKMPFTVLKADKKKAIDTAILVLSFTNMDGNKKEVEDTVLMANIFKEDEEIKPGKLSNYKVALGHSFDFFDQNNPFLSQAKVNIFLPNIVPDAFFGLDITLYQNKANFVDSTLRTGGQEMALDILPVAGQNMTNDSLYFKRTFYNRKTSTTNNNYGLNMGFIFDIVGNNSATKTAGTDVFLLLNLEFVYRKISYEYDYTLRDSATIKAPANYPPRYSTYITSLKRESFETYAGGGIMIRNTSDPLEATMKFNFGWLVSEGLDNPIFRKGFYYSLDLEFIEKITKLNLTLGGQVRNFTAGGAKPLYNVYLSKTFTLEKLKDFLFEK